MGNQKNYRKALYSISGLGRSGFNQMVEKINRLDERFNRLIERINQMVERISPADWSQFAFAAVTEKSSVTEISSSLPSAKIFFRCMIIFSIEQSNRTARYFTNLQGFGRHGRLLVFPVSQIWRTACAKFHVLESQVKLPEIPPEVAYNFRKRI